MYLLHPTSAGLPCWGGGEGWRKKCSIFLKIWASTLFWTVDIPLGMWRTIINKVPFHLLSKHPGNFLLSKGKTSANSLPTLYLWGAISDRAKRYFLPCGRLLFFTLPYLTTNTASQIDCCQSVALFLMTTSYHSQVIWTKSQLLSLTAFQ